MPTDGGCVSRNLRISNFCKVVIASAAKSHTDGKEAHLVSYAKVARGPPAP